MWNILLIAFSIRSLITLSFGVRNILFFAFFTLNMNYMITLLVKFFTIVNFACHQNISVQVLFIYIFCTINSFKVNTLPFLNIIAIRSGVAAVISYTGSVAVASASTLLLMVLRSCCYRFCFSVVGAGIMNTFGSCFKIFSVRCLCSQYLNI